MLRPGRLAAILVGAASLVAACGPGPSTPPHPSAASPSIAASPSSSPEPSPSTQASPSFEPSPSPVPSPSPSPSPEPTAPTAKAFWAAVTRGISASGRLRIRVIGPNAGEIRYQPKASATVMDGSITFVCTGDRAYDGQDGFSRLPGKWECGSTALVSGFRRFGQPVDSWGKESPADRAIREELILNGDGSWEWRYSATSDVYGGAVRTSVLLDPATGEILRASRTDPLGDTTYGISYSEQFPPIAVP